VKAKAKPFISGKNPELQQLLRSTDATLQTEARFSISILTEGLGEAPPKIVYMPAETTFTRMIFQPATIPQQAPQAIADINGQKGGVSITEQEFTLQPMIPKLDVIAYQQWQNKIFVQGIYNSNDYAEVPFIKVEYRNNDRTGSAEMVNVREGELIIRGIAPASAAMTVKVTGKRKADNKVVTTEFIVDPRVLKDPEIPKFMYPDYEYVFKPEMPSSNNMDARVILRNSQRILEENSQGKPFTFKPEIEDTGTVVFFERIINGKIVGKSYSIRVLPNPIPEIVSLTKVGNSITVEVRSYGKCNGRPNSSRIEFVKGTAVNVLPAQDNRADYDAKNQYFTLQKFVIKPKDSGKAFSAIIVSRDKFGKVSDEMPIQSD
jgi:hypothetical protein